MSHVVLVGPMGAGKTTVGRALAERLGRPFVDTDELVEAVAGRSVAELFATEGEAAFRVREAAAVQDACAAPSPIVLSCGGGAILDPDSRALLARAGTVVWLDATPEVLARRVDAARGERPLLASGDPVATLARVRALREDAFASVAHARVDTAALTPDEVVDAVVEALGAPETP